MNKEIALAGAGAALVLVAAAVVLVRRAGHLAKTKLNPLSPENVAYSGVNAVGGAITGDANFSLGARLFEWFNPDKVEAENRAIGTAIDNVTGIDQNVAAASSLPAYKFKPGGYYDLGAKPGESDGSGITAKSGYEYSPASFGAGARATAAGAAAKGKVPWSVFGF